MKQPAPAAGGDVAEIVLGVWREVLGDESLGPDDDFFLNGGHSLLAVQLTDRLGAAIGVEPPLLLLLLHPTPAELTAAVVALLGSPDDEPSSGVHRASTLA